MKIIIVNGKHEADYVIKTFQTKKNDLIIINKDKDICDFLSFENKLDVYFGDATKEYTLQDNSIEKADLFIALSSNDTENYIACLLAKRVFHVKKCICTVLNPKKVDLFKSLGIDVVVCSTYLLSNHIKSESYDDLIKSMSIMNNHIVLSQITITSKNVFIGKKLMDVQFPAYANISCIYRDPEVVIPNGTTVFAEGDRLIIVSTPHDQQSVIEYVVGETNG